MPYVKGVGYVKKTSLPGYVRGKAMEQLTPDDLGHAFEFQKRGCIKGIYRQKNKQVAEMYMLRQRLWTLQRIADLYGLTRQAVSSSLRRYCCANGLQLSGLGGIPKPRARKPKSARQRLGSWCYWWLRPQTSDKGPVSPLVAQLMAIQQARYLSDKEFAPLLNIHYQYWLSIRLGRHVLGPKPSEAAIIAFPELAGINGNHSDSLAYGSLNDGYGSASIW